MKESTPKSSLDEADRLNLATEEDTNVSNQNSPLSGGSDIDGSERPVREKLKKASIAGLSTHARTGDAHDTSENVGADSLSGGENKYQTDAMLTDTTPSRGRPTRKRSFDDLQNESTTGVGTVAHDDATRPGGHHKRLRSRDMSSTTKAIVNGSSEREQVEALAEEEDDADAKMTPGGAGVMVEAPSLDQIIDDEVEAHGNQSPKKKRSRDQFDKDHIPEDDAEREQGSKEVPEILPRKRDNDVIRTAMNNDKGEPEKKRHRDVSQDSRKSVETQLLTAEVEKPSGFANVSNVSPFGALANSSSPTKQTSDSEKAPNEQQQTSSSAFALSGLSAFSASDKSAFSNLSSFAGSGSVSGFGSSAPRLNGSFGSSSGFAGVSAFATKKAPGFGGLGGGAFTTWKLGTESPHTGISSFGPAGGSSGVLGSGHSSNIFGQSEDNDESRDEDDDAASPKTEDEGDVRDSRFYKKPLETGEEEEETMFSCRAKLFHFEKEWKERGVGTIKLNVQQYAIKNEQQQAAEETPPEQKARLIMRTDGVHRVVLNTPVFKGMKFGTPDGGEPTGKTLNLTGVENGKPALFLLKIGKEDSVKDLYHRIASIHDSLT